ncbi:hypothetical protein G5S35_17495 [Paraburkholderia tropica]|uniref:hypothetical protein n=1 Tax=Paraburkholderia tropica TaxID=92647 RepID=UPI0016007DA0|nr:hypothetical protein [Paraburkholderia tropica]QNB13424.1 hypothetical protein G5S35_17495 [Paraburkholderia tropica]
MYRIDDATASTTLPTPETASTEGYFTEGNPATGTLATKVRGSWLNMIQEELRAIVVAGGLTPSKTVYNQVLTAIKALGTAGQLGAQPHGQCRLSVASPTSLLLSPYNGNLLTVNGAPTQIPAAGLTLANTGLSGPVSVSSYSLTSNVMTLTTSTAHGLSVGSRVYIENEALGANGSYVVTAVGSTTTFSFAFTASNASGSESGCTAQPVYYAYVNSTPALVASQVGYTVQSNGIATQTGNTALTLVGMFMVNASGFIDSDAYRWCLNWFNRRPRRAAVASTATGTYSSTTAYGEVSSVYRTRFMMWADDVPQLIFTGTVTGPSTASSINYVAAIDSPGNSMTPATLQTTGSSYSSTIAGVGIVDATVSALLTPNEGGTAQC